ncbi:MAG: LolA family protein [Bradymonadaceae bacterium]
MQRLVPVALLITILFALMGCPRQVPPPDNAIEDPQELRHAIDGRFAHVEDARFLNVVLDYFGDGERVRMRQLIAVQRPNRLLVQTRLPGSDEILNRLVSNGETFGLHNRDTNEYFTGAPTRENINRLLPVDLSGADVVRVMLGGAPWDRFDYEPGEPDLSWDRRRGEYEFKVATREGGTLSMFVRHTDFAVTGVLEINRAGDRVYEYTTGSWRTEDSLVLPRWRRFVWPDQDLDFSLDVGETQLNVELPDQLFDFPPPPGSRIIHLEENRR